MQNPLIDFRLFRHLNFLAANISQLLAGMIELGLGFLMPFYLLLVSASSPAAPGIALLPGTIPIILAGPLAGRVVRPVRRADPARHRLPRARALRGRARDRRRRDDGLALIPGLAPAGHRARHRADRQRPDRAHRGARRRQRARRRGSSTRPSSSAARSGSPALLAIELSYYYHELDERFADAGLHPTRPQITTGPRLHPRGRADRPEERRARTRRRSRWCIDDPSTRHVDAFQLIFYATAGIALLGALVCFVLVRKDDRVVEGPDLQPALALDLRQRRPHPGDHEAPAAARGP